MMLPEPVSAMAVRVVGPSGLIPGLGLSVALPERPVVSFGRSIFTTKLCEAGSMRANSVMRAAVQPAAASAPSAAADTSTGCPTCNWEARASSTRTSSRRLDTSSSTSSGRPGVAMAPGSTLRSLTIASNGATSLV